MFFSIALTLIGVAAMCGGFANVIPQPFASQDWQKTVTGELTTIRMLLAGILFMGGILLWARAAELSNST